MLTPVEADQASFTNGDFSGQFFAFSGYQYQRFAAGEVPLDGILCPGHVSVIIGTEAYRPLVERHGKGCVVTGFEPAAMLKGILRLVEMVRDRRPGLDRSGYFAFGAMSSRSRASLSSRPVMAPSGNVRRRRISS